MNILQSQINTMYAWPWNFNKIEQMCLPFISTEVQVGSDFLFSLVIAQIPYYHPLWNVRFHADFYLSLSCYECECHLQPLCYYWKEFSEFSQCNSWSPSQIACAALPLFGYIYILTCIYIVLMNIYIYILLRTCEPDKSFV